MNADAILRWFLQVIRELPEEDAPVTVIRDGARSVELPPQVR